MTCRFDPMKATARDGAAGALARYDFALLQSHHAADQVVRSWGIDRDEAMRLVSAERSRRATGR